MPPADDVGGAQVFRQVSAAVSGRSLDGELVNGGAGGSGSGGVVVVVSTVPQPTGLTLRAAGGTASFPPGTDGTAGFTAWLN